MTAKSVNNNLEATTCVCEKYGVKPLYLFGSRADNFISTLSDLDFFIDYFKDAEVLPKAPFDYFNVLLSLQDITGKKIDVVVKDALKNSYFKKKLRNY